MGNDKTDSQRGFTPCQEVLDLLPGISGNDINGLGETDFRNPSPIMWHDPDIIPHGELQKWFSRRENSHRDIKNFDTGKGSEQTALPETAGERANWTPEEATFQVKKQALARGTDIVGITRLDQDWVFDGYEANYDWMIVLVIAMDFDALALAPSEATQNEVKSQYNRGTQSAYSLAGWLRENGWDAIPHGGPQAGPVLMIPAAISAGLGQLGKHGSMINQRYGSSFRLANVLTNLPLTEDIEQHFGSEEFCTNCQLCTNVCPVDAISSDKKMIRGTEKWYVDFDRCIPFFVENNSCAMCLPICPWSRPGIAQRLAAKASRKPQA